jgi:type VI secretion system secreted protein Hcp
MAQVDFFLKLEGIEGEAMAKGHEKWIELESFSWGASQGSSAGQGGGSGTGKVAIKPMNFAMKANKASPKLFLACASGEHIKKAVLVCRKAGKDQQPYYTITLSDVTVSNYQAGGSTGHVIPMDQHSLSFSKIEFEYKPQKPDGTLDSAVKAGWDVGQGAKI